MLDLARFLKLSQKFQDSSRTVSLCYLGILYIPFPPYSSVCIFYSFWLCKTLIYGKEISQKKNNLGYFLNPTMRFERTIPKCRKPEFKFQLEEPSRI